MAHASCNAVGRALPSLCLAVAVLRAATAAVAKPVRSAGKARRRAEALSFNHSPPPRDTPCLAAARRGPTSRQALSLRSQRTKRASEQRHLLAGFARLLAARRFLFIDRDGPGEHCERTNKGCDCRASFARCRSREQKIEDRSELPITVVVL